MVEWGGEWKQEVGVLGEGGEERTKECPPVRVDLEPQNTIF